MISSTEGTSDSMEPIAIIGMACRWPSDAKSKQDNDSAARLWDFLQKKQDAYSDFPAERLNVDSWYHPDSHRPGSFFARGGCFLKADPREFDNTFFGINPQETLSIDPAQRKFLEVVYEATESAGVPLQTLSGSKTGCFVGNFNNDHQIMQQRDTEYPGSYSMTGGGITLLSNRVSYVFNLHGPSLTLDTSCSSSMYALHLACSAIQSGECSAAIVGGSNLILTPECQMVSSALGTMSKNSRCNTFDVSADGYARADGVGALYVKSLKQAIADNDPIRAIVRGTAINANGRTGGITHPDPDGQEAAITRAYERAGGIDPRLTAYFECHGTGTPVGDPLEVEAIGRVFAQKKTAESPLYIGSVKTNLGHSEPVSGIAGIMKAVLAIEHGIIPPIRGLTTLNPNIDLRHGRLKIVQESTLWPAGPVRRASINSIGYGGANAHTILEGIDTLAPGCGGVRGKEVIEHHSSTDKHRNNFANGHTNGHINGHTNGHTNGHANGHTNGSPNGHTNGYVNGHSNGSANGHTRGLSNGHTNGHTNGSSNGHVNGHSIDDTDGDSDASPQQSRRYYLLPFSAHNEPTLRANVAALRSQVDRWSLFDLSYTLGCRRSLFASRSFAVADQMQARTCLDADTIAIRKVLGSQTVKLGFIFTGQGAQWPQMGLQLMNAFPTYLKSIRELDYVLGNLNARPKWTIEGSLRAAPESSQLHRAAMSQPLVTAIQIALVDLLASWGITPSVSAGHSSGEIAASYASGRLTAAEAIIAAYARGRAVSRNTMNGAMLAVGLGSDAGMPLLKNYSTVRVACHNSPQSITLSGDQDEIVALKEALDAQGIFARVLSTDGNAYHSHHMQPLGAIYQTELTEMLSQYSSKRGNTTQSLSDFVSSVTGKVYTKPSIDARYWRSNLESPVLFHQAVTNLVQTFPVDLLVEIGPHSALQGPLRQIAKSLQDVKFPDYVPSLIRKEDGAMNILQTVGNLFTKGCDIDIQRVNSIEVLDQRTNIILDVRSGDTIVDLPRYQWQYGDLLYTENRSNKEFRLRSHARHDLLGSRTAGGNWNEPTWRNIIQSKSLPWLQDHKMGSHTIFPTSGYLSMALEAASQLADIKGISASNIASFTLENIYIGEPLILPDGGNELGSDGVEVLLGLHPCKLNDSSYYQFVYDFAVTSVQQLGGSDVFTERAHGKIGFELQSTVAYPLELRTGLNDRKTISSSQWYDALARAGVDYGPTFRSLSDIQVQGEALIAESQVRLHPIENTTAYDSRYIIHPAAMDAIFQLAVLAALKGRTSQIRTGFKLESIERLTIRPPNKDENLALAVAQVPSTSVGSLAAHVSLEAGGNQILHASSVHLIAFATDTRPSFKEHATPFTRIAWQPDFSLLTGPKAAKLCPPTVPTGDDRVLPVLDQLALHQAIQFHAKYPEFFNKGSKASHLQRFLDWMALKAGAAVQDQLPGGAKMANLSIPDRDQEMKRLQASLMKDYGAETRLMCHMYENLPAIYRGEKTGIEAAVENHYLDDLYEYMKMYQDGTRVLKDMVALISHENPRLKIFEVGGGTGSATREVLPALRGHTPYRGYDSYTFTDLGTSFLAAAQDTYKRYDGVVFAPFDMQSDPASQGFKADYDLIIASNVIHATTDIQNTLSNIRRLMKPGAKLILFELVQARPAWNIILGTFSDFWNGQLDPHFPRMEGPFLDRAIWNEVLPRVGFTGIDLMLDHFAENKQAGIIVATAKDASPVPQNGPVHRAVTVVYRKSPSDLVSEFCAHLQATGYSVDLIPLTSTSALRHERVIFLAEVDQPLFTDIDSSEWQGFKHLASSSTSALWVTKGSLIDGKSPEYAIISGIARALHTETKGSRFVIADLDQDDTIPQEEEFNILVQLEERAASYSAGDDYEFRVKSGVVHIPRLQGDDALNEAAFSTATSQETTESMSLAEDPKLPVTMAVNELFSSSSVYFETDKTFVRPLERDSIEIEVKAAGLNKKAQETGQNGQIAVSLGKECSGVVVRVGAEVQNFKSGDRVYGLTSSTFGTFVRAKAAFCQKMENGDTFEAMASLPIAFSTAIHALANLARLRKGQTILIQSASGDIGLAACQIANFSSAEIYATVGSSEKKQDLLSMGLGIHKDHIFLLRSKDTVDNIMKSTGGRGVDVILSTGGGELLHQYWQCIADFGCFIEIGGSEVIKNGKLDMSKFQRSANFTSFDLDFIGENQPSIISSLIKRTRDLHVEGTIQSLPIKTFSVSLIDEALAELSKPSGAEKLVVSYGNPQDTVQFRQSPSKVVFAPDASYVLVGALGGLGQSLARWMVARGARKLVFLSRTGASGPRARDFVHELQSVGVALKIVKGDVTSEEAVQRAIKISPGPIKGVVQAPLNLRSTSIADMSLDDFNTTLQPHLTGTLNLHRNLEHASLDFFLMLSSWTSIFGSSSQANYMAANSFMDAFARHRRSLNLPATSLSLGQILDVGSTSYTPEYQEDLIQIGLYGNSEEEFIRYCDAAISESKPKTSDSDSNFSKGHLLAGVDPDALLERDLKHPVHEMPWFSDPRFSNLIQAMNQSAFDSAQGQQLGVDDNINDTLINRIHTRVARLIYIPKDDIDVTQPINSYGIDSLVAAELRNWLMGTFGTEITLLHLLNPTMSVEKLTEEVKASVASQQN